jgi:hypothetical protein
VKSRHGTASKNQALEPGSFACAAVAIIRSRDVLLLSLSPHRAENLNGHISIGPGKCAAHQPQPERHDRAKKPTLSLYRLFVNKFFLCGFFVCLASVRWTSSQMQTMETCRQGFPRIQGSSRSSQNSLLLHERSGWIRQGVGFEHDLIPIAARTNGHRGSIKLKDLQSL